jgi:leucyl/phenylalanyl-tRNA--protein transferase
MKRSNMPITRFPDPLSTAEDGIVAIGGDFHPESLLLAYRQGIFPWPIEGYPFVWFCPKKRGVLYFDQIHISRSLSKSLKHTSFRLTRDMAFKNVIEACAMVHMDHPRNYERLYRTF